MESRLLGGEIFEPSAPQRDRRIPNVSNLSGSGLPFDLAFMHEWEFCTTPEVHEDGEWLPHIREIRYTPGGNGVRTVGKGQKARMVTSPAITGMMEKGAEVVKFGDRRLGPFRRFLKRLPARGRFAWFYCLAGVQIAMLNNDTAAVPVVDKEWMVNLRRQFVTGGIAEPMSPQALDTEVSKIRSRLTRFREMVERGEMTAGAYENRRDDGLERIAAMEAAWARQYKEDYEEMVREELNLDQLDAAEFIPEYGEDPVPDAPSAHEIAPKGKGGK